jgi:hypothetical protein
MEEQIDDIEKNEHIPYRRTKTFCLKLEGSIRNSNYPISELIEPGYNNPTESKTVIKSGIGILGDILKNNRGQFSTLIMLTIREVLKNIDIRTENQS